jgi:hypothetical protein
MLYVRSDKWFGSQKSRTKYGQFFGFVARRGNDAKSDWGNRSGRKNSECMAKMLEDGIHTYDVFEEGSSKQK